MSSKITKAVIPVAGLGTRFLPATKTVPKELLPIVDKPLLLHIIEECAQAGIEDVILVTGRGKTAIEDFFDTSYELEDALAKSGKQELLEKVQALKSLVNIISIRQQEAKGLGHAIYTAQPILGNDAFAVLLGDEVMISDENTPSATGELCSLYQETKTSSVAVMEVPKADVQKYGIVACDSVGTNRWKIQNVIEKPHPEEAPSQLALPGRYVFSTKILSNLKNTKPGKNGEIQLTDAMCALAQSDGLLGMTVQARRYDAGDKFGFLQANIEMGLQHPEVQDQLKKYLKTLAKTL
ncbi:MAG: UTP--glucose-1-phosphate uridylyltransferase GalU [Bdellovibrionales bacterium]|nr:UTP--glucose-1-phosphate uridylyltransferase GalU [Bdellovibrionales bacterium]